MSKSVVEPNARNVAIDINGTRPIRVLHVDDDSSLLKIAKQCLEIEAQVHVDAAMSVDEALAKLGTDQYDVVVSDYLMPGKDGLDFLKELRQNRNMIPFIMFTGRGREEVAIKALNLGANQYINKVGETETVYTELAHSITEVAKAKRAEEEQRQSEEKFQDLFEKANDGLVFFDMTGTILDVNQKAAEIAGKSKESIVGKSFLDLGLVSSKQIPALAERLESRKMGRPLDRVEVEIKKKNGETRTIEISSQIIRKNNDPAGFLAIARDITERKKTEEALRESEERFRSLFEKAHDGLVLIGFDGRIIDINEKATELAGMQKEEIVGKPFLKLGLVSWKNIPQLLGRLKGVFKRQPEGDFKVEIRRKTGELRHLEVNTSTIEQNDVPIGALAIVRDITDRIRTEEARCESEQKLKAILASSPDAITVFDLQGNVIDLNTEAMKLQGFTSKEEVVGKSSFDFVVPEDRKRAIDAFQGLAKRGQVKDLEFKLLNKKGRVFPVLLSAAVILDTREKPSAVVATFRDITEQKAATAHRLETAAAIQQSQQKFEALFRGNPEASVYLSPDFTIQDANPRFLQLFGYHLDEIKGVNIDAAVVQEERMGEAKELNTKAISGYVYHDTLRKRKDGKLIPVSVSAAPIIVGDHAIGYVGIYKDISEQKCVEGQLAAINEKLRVVGGLTRHDVRNKLAVITGNLYLMRKRLGNECPVGENLKEIQVAVEQIVRIFEFAKDYEMLGLEELSYVSVEDSFGKAVALFTDLKNVKIVCECKGLSVLADSLLRQLFYNLIHNSLKHGQKVQQIRMHCENMQDHLKLICEDDGVGISEVDRPNLFKEGYGKGTGYGLYLIRRMMEVYGWKIQETGESGKGARFTITIPLKSRSEKPGYVFD